MGSPAVCSTFAALKAARFVQPACSAASLTALRRALEEKVAPETASTPEPLASSISAIMGAKAMSPTWPVSVELTTSIPVMALSEKVTLKVELPL